MSEDSDDLEKLLESVADGESIDWDELERRAPDEAARQVIRQLRLIADVADVHRSQIDADSPVADSAAAAVTATVISGEGQRDGEHRQLLPHIGAAAVSGNQGVWRHLLLVRKIGEGSYGEVYQAHDPWLDHPVALKLLKPEAESRVQPSDLLHEARKLARVRHPNVVVVHGADRHNGRVGFWMDFIDGETLASRVARGRLSAGEAVSVGQEVCQALAAVHRANIIHRDVKAQNVMRAHDGGRIILMDFGAGQFFEDASLGGRAQGTPLYLAPELLERNEASVRSDIYAVGILLYHLVTGRFPVEALSPAELADAHKRGERRRLRDERPELPDSFIAIVERAIDRDPARRYASAGEMEAKLSGEPTGRVPVPPRPDPDKRTTSRYVARAAAVAVATVSLTGVLGFISARAFEVALRIDPDFSLGLSEVFRVGSEGLLPFLVYWVIGAAVLGALAGLRPWLPRRITTIVAGLLASSGSVNPAAAGTVVFLLGATLFLGMTWMYSEVFSVLWALREDPRLPSAALSILRPASRGVHQYHGIYSALLSFLLGLAVWRVFPHLERRAEDVSTLRAMRWGTLAIAFLVIAAAVVPRRAVWESFKIVSFDSRPALVIGSTKEELLLYAPDEDGRPRYRVRAGSPDVGLTGETRALFGAAP